MNVKRNLFIVFCSIPVVMLVYAGEPVIAAIVAVLVVACCIFVPALQSPAKPESGQPAQPADVRF